MRIGIDVGGTHTDAVLVSDDAVLETCKVLTTADVTTGFQQVIHQLQQQYSQHNPSSSFAHIEAVMIGTTQFTNAVVQRKELSPVAAIRLGSPSGRGLPPFVGWPHDIATIIGGTVYELHGGYLYDGSLLAELNDTEITQLIDDLKARQHSAVAITCAFSPMNATHELELAKRIKTALPQVRVTLSHEIGRMGLLERENATLLNAALLCFADDVCDAISDAVIKSNLCCPVFITQNDGTLMDLEFCRQFPALTFASGPTNSLRGAAKLTGLDNAIVLDVGGTTTDIGVLRNGFPRESNLVVEVGGVRTNFRMPDILAIGLGGGSLIENNGLSVGPKSVGHNLIDQALVFGGSTLTSSDIAVAAGLTSMGDNSLVEHLDRQLLDNTLQTISMLLAAGVRKMNPGNNDLPLVLVGGGAALVPRSFEAGLDVIRPKHSGVANALGAAIAQIGGEAERFVSYGELTREAAIDQVREAAYDKAMAAGAYRQTLRVSDIEEVSIPYMENGATRIRVKVIGEVKAIAEQCRPPAATGEL